MGGSHFRQNVKCIRLLIPAKIVRQYPSVALHIGYRMDLVSEHWTPPAIRLAGGPFMSFTVTGGVPQSAPRYLTTPTEKADKR